MPSRAIFILIVSSLSSFAICPIEDFFNPILSHSAQFQRTSHDFYFFGGMHAGLDIIAPEGTDVFAVSDGIPSILWVYGERTSKYMETMKIDHQNGYVSIYTHIDLSKIPDKIRQSIELGIVIKRGTKITELNSGSGSISPHLHFTILNERKHEVINPLDCYYYEDSLRPSIRSFSLSKKGERKSVSKLESNDYDIYISASDKVENEKHQFNIRKLNYSINMELNNRSYEIVKNKILFDAAVIPCGYECLASNFWDNSYKSFINRKKNLFVQWSFNDSYAMYLSKLNSDKVGLDSTHYNPIENFFSPCEEYKSFSKERSGVAKFIFTVRVYDFKNNYDEVRESLDLEVEDCY